MRPKLLALLALLLLPIAGAQAARSHSLYQFAYLPGTDVYQWGAMDAIPHQVTGAPADADWSRWSMLHDHDAYRLYVYRKGSSSLYQFAFDGQAYAWGYHSIPEITIAGLPADADTSHFAMLWDGADYRFYVRRAGVSSLYQAAWVAGTDRYQYAYHSIAEIPIAGFPTDTDWSGWSMLHDGTSYRLYAMRSDSRLVLYQGAFDAGSSRYVYGHDSIPRLTVVGTPQAASHKDFAMLFGEGVYRLYLMGK